MKPAWWHGWVFRIEEGGVIPRGYGVAYREPTTRGVVLMPLPVNLIVRRLRDWHWKMACPGVSDRERWLALQAEVSRGRQEIAVLRERLDALHAADQLLTTLRRSREAEQRMKEHAEMRS